MTDSTTTPNFCPLCGAPNACAQSLGLGPDAPCWCQNIDFSADLLAKVPETQRNLACICEACARSATKQA